MTKLIHLTLGALLLGASSTAHAHLDIDSHEARITSGSEQKTGPCGKAGSKRGDGKIHTFASGETISLEITESIPHPGWFRISFDDDGEDDFASPESIDPPKFYVNDTVLMDELDMHETAGFGEKRKWEVKLPDVECDNCTLQIIQVMLDKPPYDPQDNGAFSNDIYYRCLDVVLKRTGGSTTTADASVGSADAGKKPGTSDAGTAGAVPTSDAGSSPAAKGDGGDDTSTTEPSTETPRDAGRSTSARDAGASSSPTGGRAKDAGASPEDDGEDEEEEEEEEKEKAASSESEGCTLGASSSARDGGLVSTGLLSLLALSWVRRRRRP